MSALESLSRAVVFRVGETLLAVDVQGVERVLRHTTPRPVPRMPDWVAGVIDLGERLVPVLDVRRRLSPAPSAIGLHTRILLLDLEGAWCGLVVDQVLDVRAYQPSEVVAPPPLVQSLAGGLVTGALRRGDQTLLCIDPRAVLAPAEHEVLRDVVGEVVGG